MSEPERRKNGLPYYKAYPRDFIEGTVGMPLELKGAYRILLDAIYMQGGNLPDDPGYIAGLLGCTKRKWSVLRKTLIDMDKIQVIGEFLSNYRAVIELETLRKLQENNAENRRGSSKINNLQKRPSNHTEPEPECVSTDVDTHSATSAPRSPKRATRLHENWQPDERMVAYANEKGFFADEINRLRDDIIDWSLSSPKGAKRDWQATWRNWVRRKADDKASDMARSTNGTGRQRQGPVSQTAVVFELLAEREGIE